MADIKPSITDMCESCGTGLPISPEKDLCPSCEWMTEFVEIHPVRAKRALPYLATLLEEKMAHGSLNDSAEIEKRFTYHPPQDGQRQKYEALRDKARDLAIMVVDLCPDSRERSLAITALEECVMWASASIARRE